MFASWGRSQLGRVAAEIPVEAEHHRQWLGLAAEHGASAPATLVEFASGAARGGWIER